MSVSIWLVLPCVWASLGQLFVKIRGILIDLGAIIFFGRLRLSGKEGVTRIPESKRARQPTWPYTRHTPQDHEVVACDGPRHRCRRERGVCLPDRTGRVWCLQCGTRPRRAACDRRRTGVRTAAEREPRRCGESARCAFRSLRNATRCLYISSLIAGCSTARCVRCSRGAGRACDCEWYPTSFGKSPPPMSSGGPMSSGWDSDSSN